MVVHAKSGRRISYGEVAKFATVPAEPPKIAEADLKKPAQFRLIGRRDIGRVDVPSKVNGTAKLRHRRAGAGHGLCLGAGIADGRRQGRSAQHADVMKIKGVTRVIPLPFGVAVIGDTVEATRSGRNALKVNWDTSQAKAAPFDSEKAKEEYARKAKDPATEAKEWYKVGDADKAIAGAAKVLEATYWSEHTYHAQMEPMNAVASVSEDGQSAEIWVGTQVQPLAAAVVANVLKTTPDKIKINLQLLGGGFGRRIWPDAPVQAAVLSNIVKKPVKLILTPRGRRRGRAAAADDRITCSRPGSTPRTDLVGWHHRLVAENVDARCRAAALPGDRRQGLHRLAGLEQEYYTIPNIMAEASARIRGMRVHAWRGIGAGYNKFASECFVDEIAAARGVDPLAMRLELTKDHPRANAVVRAAAEMADWGRKREGRGLGIAFSDYHESFSAAVAEVSVDRNTGKIKVHNYWIAADPGLVIQPDNVHGAARRAPSSTA